MTKGPNHENALAELNAFLVRLVTEGYHVRPGSPVRIPDESEPEPDLLVVRGKPRDYQQRHPGPGDVGLAVEIADSSLAYDTGEKLAAYAEALIPIYWVVNVPSGRVDVYSMPSGPGPSPTYANHCSYGPDDEVPVILDGREIGRVVVKDVLP